MLFTNGILLEEGIEDGVYIDLNKDMGLDHKYIEDIIDGNEANTEEIEDAQDAEFSPKDEAYAIIAESEYNWGQILECVGIYELNEVASGRTPMLEEASKAGFIERAKEFFSKLAEKVAMMCKKAILKLVGKSNVINRYITKNRDAIIEGSKHLSGEETFNAVAYSYKDLADYGSWLAGTFIDDEKRLAHITSSINKKGNVSVKGGGIMNKSLDDIRSDYLLNGKRKGSVSADEFRDAILDSISSGEASSVRSYIDKMGGISSLINNSAPKDLTRSINSAYKGFEKGINNAIKLLNRMKKELDNEGGVSKVTEAVNHLKSIKNIGIVATSTYISACMSCLSQNVRAITACVKAYRATAKESTKNGGTVLTNELGNIEYV